MPGLSDVLEVARRSLAAQRIVIDTIGHNISNAGTDGYSRQRVDLAATMPFQTSYGLLGSGVTVAHIGRIRDKMIDSQIRSANDSLGSADEQQKIISQIEAAVNEPSDNGLSTALDNFFNSFQDLSLHPEDAAHRNAVIQKATLLTQSFNQLNSNIALARSDLLTDAQTQVNKINSLTKEISNLDLQIFQYSGTHEEPSDLEDQRDLKIDELSKIARISVSEDPKGSMMITMGGTLIASRAGALELKTTMVGNQIKIGAVDSEIEVKAQSGTLGGLLDCYNSKLPGYTAQLDQLASALIQQVNQIHSAGFGLGNPPSTGNNFFAGTSAATIAIDSGIANDPNKIAASQNGQSGDNANALAISDLKDRLLMNGNTVSLPQYYNDFASAIGSDLNSFQSVQTTQGLVLQQLNTQKDSVSGVSIDEEMTNLIQYQRAFDASAKLVSTVDQMFVTILNMVQ